MLLHLVLAAISLQDSTVTYCGRAKRIQIDVPRIDTVVNIDGNLDEAVWSRAARPFPEANISRVSSHTLPTATSSAISVPRAMGSEWADSDSDQKPSQISRRASGPTRGRASSDESGESGES